MKLQFALVLAGLALLLGACAAAPNYDDVKAAVEQQIADADTFSKAVNDANTTKDVAAALTVYARAFADGMAGLKAALDKHPESSSGEMPEALKEVFSRQQKIKDTVAAAVAKITSNADVVGDPDVQAALAQFVNTPQ